MLGRLLEKWGRRGRELAAVPPSGLDPAGPAGRSGGHLLEWQVGDLILDRYRVEQVMSGAMGRVYITEHLGWGTRMAVKSPRPEVLADREGVKRILKEANGWIRMGMHPNIAACYFVLAIGKIPHLFIEYVDGGSLADWLKAGKCRDLRTALSLAIQFCHGMEFTHGRGIVHRDIKPANILVTRSSLVKITDFGILLSTSEQDLPLSPAAASPDEATVGFRGTPGFASPEQFNNTHAVDGRTDIFSFGICLWLMLCGKKPFKHNAVQEEIPEPAPADSQIAFPPLLKEILRKCVAYEPADRYPDFASLRKALNDAYIAAFQVACPYAVLHQVDLRADSLNNRAVSLFELGKAEQALECLQQALELNDVLPEALHNLIVLRWQLGQLRPERALGKVEAALKRLGKEPLLTQLKEVLGRHLAASGQNPEFPGLRLCVPQSTLSIFREGQLAQSLQSSMLDHLAHRRFAACHQVLLAFWRNSNFRKEKSLSRIYEQLLAHGRKKTVESGQRLVTLADGADSVHCMAYIPFSRKIVTGSLRGRIVIWDFALRKKVTVLGRQGLPVRCLAANPKGKELAVGTEDGAIRLWEVHSFRETSTRPAHKGPVTAIAFSADGRWLVSGGADGSLLALHLASGREMRYGRQEGGGVRSLAVSPQGKQIVTGSEDGRLRFWEAGNREFVRVIDAHALPVASLSAVNDGSRFASASGDRLIKIWDSHSGRCLKIIEAHEEPITSVLMLDHGSHLASGCEDDTMKIWHLETGECRIILDGRGDGILNLAAGPKPHLFLAGRRDGAILLWTLIYSLEFD